MLNLLEDLSFDLGFKAALLDLRDFGHSPINELLNLPPTLVHRLGIKDNYDEFEIFLLEARSETWTCRRGYARL